MVLSILGLQNVDKAFECNVHRFKQMIDKVKPTQVIDFKMLLGLIEKRR